MATSWFLLRHRDYLSFPPTLELADFIPRPEGLVSGTASFQPGNLLGGASFISDRQAEFNRIIFSVTAIAGTPTLSIGIFQAEFGQAGGAVDVNRIATVTDFDPSATAGVHTVPIDEGTAVLHAGTYYLLFARSSAGSTIDVATWSNVAVDGMNQSVPTGIHPPTFSTSFSAALSQMPGRIDPRIGGDVTASTADVALVHRLRKV